MYHVLGPSANTSHQVKDTSLSSCIASCNTYGGLSSGNGYMYNTYAQPATSYSTSTAAAAAATSYGSSSYGSSSYGSSNSYGSSDSSSSYDKSKDCSSGKC